MPHLPIPEGRQPQAAPGGRWGGRRSRIVRKGREPEVIGQGIVVLLDGHECTGNTLYQIEPSEVFSIRSPRLHLLYAALGARRGVASIQTICIHVQDIIISNRLPTKAQHMAEGLLF